MVYLRTKNVNKKDYFYLVHSIREAKIHKKLEKYVGDKIPSKKELEKLSLEFMYDIKKNNLICLTKNDFIKTEEIKNNAKNEITDEQLNDFCINFTYNTNAIEGNMMSKDEIVKLVDKDKTSNKPFKDQIESFSHQKLFLEMTKTKKPLSINLLKKWHKSLFELSKSKDAGKFRETNVKVANYKAPHYLDLEILLNKFIQWYNENKKKLHPIELAALAHLKFVKIHPFKDGNGRIGRLLLNYILHSNKYPMMTIEYKNRMNYYTTLDKYDETADIRVFINYIIDRYIVENEKKIIMEIGYSPS